VLRTELAFIATPDYLQWSHHRGQSAKKRRSFPR